jgi:glutathione S-transferase
MSNGEFTLFIGTKNYSSWSLRPWIAAKVAKIPFKEVKVKLRQPDTAAEIAKFSPSGRVPVLKHGDLLIWDSLAICEYLAEIAPGAKLWPEDPSARAVARSISAEMHSSFPALRTQYPMNVRERVPTPPSADTSRDIRRIVAAWLDARRRFGHDGPFLFGGFTIADAMYMPVVTRFRTYEPDLAAHGDDGTAKAYMDAILAMPEFKAFEEECLAEMDRLGLPSAGL